METETSPEWRFLKRHRIFFYTKNMRAFIGYARKQAAKYGIKGSRLNAVREALAFLITKGDTKLGEIVDELWQDEHCQLHLVDGVWQADQLSANYLDWQRSYWEVCGKKMTLGSTASYYVPMLKKFYENYGDRARLAAQNEGVDWKAVSHALRVGYQTRDIFVRGSFEYPLVSTPFLLAVKQGQIPYHKAAGVLDELMVELDCLAKVSSLPDKPDAGFWHTWLAKVTLSHIKGEFDLITDPVLDY
jgi:hypothetical protein